jgi:hypothetical protein
MQLTPHQVKLLRKKTGKTQTKAATDVYVKLRAWQRWEADEEIPTHQPMPPALTELFCLKNKIPFPPKFS